MHITCGKVVLTLGWGCHSIGMGDAYARATTTLDCQDASSRFNQFVLSCTRCTSIFLPCLQAFKLQTQSSCKMRSVMCFMPGLPMCLPGLSSWFPVFLLLSCPLFLLYSTLHISSSDPFSVWTSMLADFKASLAYILCFAAQVTARLLVCASSHFLTRTDVPLVETFQYCMCSVCICFRACRL